MSLPEAKSNYMPAVDILISPRLLSDDVFISETTYLREGRKGGGYKCRFKLIHSLVRY